MQFRPNLESLERRDTPSVTLESGLLTVTGTEGPDYLRVTESADGIIVYDNGAWHTFARADVEAVLVQGLGGNDTLIAQEVTASLTLDGGAGNDILQRASFRTGSEASTALLLGGDGNDLIVNVGAGPVVMEGGAGNDVMASYFGSAVIVTGPGSDTVYSVFGSDEIASDSDDSVFVF